MSCSSCNGCGDTDTLQIECVNLGVDNQIDNIIKSINQLDDKVFNDSEFHHKLHDIISSLTINSHSAYTLLMSRFMAIDQNSSIKVNRFKDFLKICIQLQLLNLSNEPKHYFVWALEYTEFNFETLLDILKEKDERFNTLKDVLISRKTWFECAQTKQLKMIPILE